MRCKSCGQILPGSQKMDAEALLLLLKTAPPHREVYRAEKGGWFVSHGGGEADPEAVRQLVNEGLIYPVYSNCPNDCYHIGKTWDCERTLEARRVLGKAALDYFVGDP